MLLHAAGRSEYEYAAFGRSSKVRARAMHRILARYGHSCQGNTAICLNCPFDGDSCGPVSKRLQRLKLKLQQIRCRFRYRFLQERRHVSRKSLASHTKQHKGLSSSAELCPATGRVTCEKTLPSVTWLELHELPGLYIGVARWSACGGAVASVARILPNADELRRRILLSAQRPGLLLPRGE